MSKFLTENLRNISLMFSFFIPLFPATWDIRLGILATYFGVLYFESRYGLYRKNKELENNEKVAAGRITELENEINLLNTKLQKLEEKGDLHIRTVEVYETAYKKYRTFVNTSYSSLVRALSNFSSNFSSKHGAKPKIQTDVYEVRQIVAISQDLLEKEKEEIHNVERDFSRSSDFR